MGMAGAQAPGMSSRLLAVCPLLRLWCRMVEEIHLEGGTVLGTSRGMPNVPEIVKRLGAVWCSESTGAASRWGASLTGEARSVGREGCGMGGYVSLFVYV